MGLLLSSSTRGASPGPRAPGGLPPSASCSPHLHEGPPLASLRHVDCLPLPLLFLTFFSLSFSSSSFFSLFGFGFILLMFLPQNVNKLAILAQNPKKRPPFPLSHLQEERTRGSRWFVQSTKGRDTK